MKKIYKYLFAFLGCLFIAPLITKADCSYERQAELSKIAANVKFNYSYEIQNGSPVYNVHITNITNDIYIKDTDGAIEQIITNTNAKDIRYNYPSKRIYNIYSNDNNCKDEKILTTYVNLPFFNYYATLPECDVYPKFQLCNLWDENVKLYTQEQFYEELNKYKASLQAENINKIETEGNMIDKIGELLSEKIDQLILIFIGMVILIMALVIKKVVK